MRIQSLAVVYALALGAALPAAPVLAQQPPAAEAAAVQDAELNAFFEQAFQARIALSPQQMTSLGLKIDYDKLDDVSDAAAARALALQEAQLAEMQARFSPDRLSPQAQLSYRLFEYGVAQARAAAQWRDRGFQFTANGNPTTGLPVFMINNHRVTSVSDAEAYVARLTAAERYMGQVVDTLNARADAGVISPRFVFAPALAATRAVITGAPFDDGPDNPVWADFQRKVAALDAPEAEKARLVAAGREAYYNARLRFSTTTDLTADQIHEIGLAEVARIQAEMEAIKAEVGFEGSLQAFFTFVKTDPRFQYPNTAEGREQYLADARAFVAQVMAVGDQWFRDLPESALEVRAVEAWREATSSIAFYNAPAPDGSRPGIYYVNLSDMTQVLKPQIEGISYHEGAPGHHFQIAYAQEMDSLPRFRRFGGYGAYAEGWGLYAERLGREMGFYQDPYSNFGRLSTELWRAVRLVTDTGLHARRWTREQAIEYFRANSLLSERDIVKEVERYITNPGQATSYKIGELKIMELRDRARTRLGDRFDIRDFHAVVLGSGSMPLDVLEDVVEAWIAAGGGDPTAG